MQSGVEPIDEAVQATPAGVMRGLAASYHGYRQRAVDPAVHLGLPSPFLTLIFTLHEPLHLARHVDPSRAPGRFASLLGGLHTRPAVIRHEGAQSGIQVQLHPLAARALLGLPAGELAGLDDDAVDVLGGHATEIQERLAVAPTWDERFRILDAGLAAAVADGAATPAEVRRAWHLLCRSGGNASIAALAREVGWSERHLAARFRTETGLTPKAAGRVIRFDLARRSLQRNAVQGSVNIAGTAARYGYYDQSHLVRDFSAFTGLPPTRWLAAEFGNFQAGQDPAAQGLAS